MKAVNVLRKIFLTLAVLCVAFGVSYLMIGCGVAAADIKWVIIASCLFLFGLILAEAKTSGAHKTGLGLHLVSSLVLGVYFGKNFYDILKAGFGSVDGKVLLSVIVAVAGLGLYAFSYIFHAASTKYRGSLEKVNVVTEGNGCSCGCCDSGCSCGCCDNQCECSDNQCDCGCCCDEAPEEYYDDSACQNAPEQPAPAPQPEPAPQPAQPQQPVYPYPPFPPYGMMYPSYFQQVFGADPMSRKEEPKAEPAPQPAPAPAPQPKVEEPSPMPEDDVHVAALMKWKKLYLEGIITEREFINKRDEILNLRK